jgi:hypothetical protein
VENAISERRVCYFAFCGRFTWLDLSLDRR